MGIQQDVCVELLKKFPNTPSLTLAKIAYRDNKLLFTTLDNARFCIRRLRGASGASRRARTKIKQFMREPRQPGDAFATIPQGKTNFDRWSPLVIDGPLRALVLADIHIPYHDLESLLLALRWGKDNRPDMILLNGDIADFFSVSFWEKNPAQRDLADELKQVREFLSSVRKGFPRARIIYKAGNHEERWDRYIRVKAPEVYGIEEFKAENLLKLSDYGIEWVSDKRPIRIGQLNVLHGHEYRFAISNPVNAARGLFLRSKAYSICGHFHQKSEHSENSVEGKSISTWSTGCLCEMHPDYAPLNNWSHGFAFVEVYKDGKFTVRNLKIAGGKVY